MKRQRKQDVFLGRSEIRAPGPTDPGEWVERAGERFYRIANYHRMPPFLVSVVSGYDHWMFVSSTGGLTCGRRDPGNALFPYCTDDKVHDAWATTGPRTALRVTRERTTSLWRPFHVGSSVYDVQRNLYKNVPGNKLVFEEINHDLGLAFAYGWTTGDRFGFVRRAELSNLGSGEVRVAVLDGVRNLMPHGVGRDVQSEMSTLVDAYKQAEAVPGVSAGIYSLSSILTDRAEPNESLLSTIVWSVGLDGASILLSEDQVASFDLGEGVRPEAVQRGKRGAFLVHAELTLPAGAGRRWYVLADVEQGPSRAAALLRTIRQGVSEGDIEKDVEDGTGRLESLAGAADAFQCSADDRVAARHFSNTLFNIMRGGVFPHGYRIPVDDFLCFVDERNRPLRASAEAALGDVDGSLTLHGAVDRAERVGDDDLLRLVHEYLPLTFSRRHGDPSRPWNDFSILLRNGHGAEYLNYQGNWRDIFQNWEALAISFPEYVESFVAKFVNASTADGHNAYRISRDGIDWEVPEPDKPWSNIGYWGDHQVAYLLRLLELSRDYHPGRLDAWLTRDLFVYADVPYRIRPYADLVQDPRDTVDFDGDHAREIARRVESLGSDGKLVTLADGSIHRVGLLEKLLVSALARIANLVPGGGIWMNTQRPEWNDANNALVGFGLSMVTVGYLRRYLHLLVEQLAEGGVAMFPVSSEVVTWIRDTAKALDDHGALPDGPVDPAGRKSFVDRMGRAAEAYRTRVYRGFSGDKESVSRGEIEAFLARAVRFVDHTLEHGRRDDGLFHAYNLVRFDDDGYDVEPLDEMLEGQVAALSSGFLDTEAALGLLRSLRSSRLYREDQNSYVLYPNRSLPSFLDRNVIPASCIEPGGWIERQVEAGRETYVERDVDGRVHFNARFRNGRQLRAELNGDPAVGAEDAARLCEIYEATFEHRKFTGRSGSMYKYEGLGCIYWHMVSKLLLAVGEIAEHAVRSGADPGVVEGLRDAFFDIRDGLGVHKSPERYGAFPIDAYSHTPEFTGVQQPGLTGQVKEDVITRFRHLGVRIDHGEVFFEPDLLGRDEFLTRPASWRYTTGGPSTEEDLPSGTLAFTLCGTPVVYRIADVAQVTAFEKDGSSTALDGSCLGAGFSRRLFRRDPELAKLVVDVPRNRLR